MDTQYAHALTSGLAMAVILLAACYGLAKSLKTDYEVEGVPPRSRLKE